MSFAIQALTRSLNVFHLGGSACNNCDIEILDALTPRYDLERFGIVLVGSVKHADVILLAGVSTGQPAAAPAGPGPLKGISDPLPKGNLRPDTPVPAQVQASGVTCACAGTGKRSRSWSVNSWAMITMIGMLRVAGSA